MADDEAVLAAPFYPIIYVRGYAGNEDEIEDTVSDPYMGFNLGSTKIRQLHTGKIARHYFESPLVRLMKDYKYRDVYSSGIDLAKGVQPAPRSIIIYRYYDQVSESFGSGHQATMETFGKGLNDLVLTLRDRVSTDPKTGARDQATFDRFKVYLVGHSMGGLVIRTFIQNPGIGSKEARALVDKVFTYATPHNGIDFQVIGNVPNFFSAESANNFNRERMYQYLALPKDAEAARSLNGQFDIDRIFCLVGTNAQDYAVAKGWSARVVGPLSDGLVRINNAIASGNRPGEQETRLAPRAYVHRSHSGYYGIVNSEEGYQNLTRFLFGDVRVDGRLSVTSITLPPDLDKVKATKTIVASYNFECVTRVRGATWDLSRRTTDENSAILRSYDDLMGRTPGPNRDVPDLFTLFLSSRAKVDADRPSLGFAIEIGVQVPEYEVDGLLFFDNHYPGGYLFRDKLNIEATPPAAPGESWKILYGFDSQSPNRATKAATIEPGAGVLTFRVPIVQKTKPGIDAELIFTAREWNADDAGSPPEQVPVSG